MFFAANRQNYARWMVRYHLNLLNVDPTHPGVRDSLVNGALSIRRSDKSFSRNAVDMTLEQTINADAASRHTGITAFTNSMAARRKWMTTKTIRSAVVGHLLKRAGMKSTDECTQELKPYRIQRDNQDLQKIIERVEGTMNPFDHEAPDRNLYCIATGKAVHMDIKVTYNTIQYNTIQYNTIQYNTIQYNTIQYNTIQYNTIQYNTIQYNTIQYNTIQYNTICLKV